MFDSGLIDVCKKNDMGVIIGGVLNQGFADELINIRPDAANQMKNDPNPDAALRGIKLGLLYDLCAQSGIPILDLSMRYALSFDEIHCHIPGARFETHVKQNIEISRKGSLPKDVVEQIVNISKNVKI